MDAPQYSERREPINHFITHRVIANNTLIVTICWRQQMLPTSLGCKGRNGRSVAHGHRRAQSTRAYLSHRADTDTIDSERNRGAVPPPRHQGIARRSAQSALDRFFAPASSAQTRTRSPIRMLVGGFRQCLLEQSKTRRSRCCGERVRWGGLKAKLTERKSLYLASGSTLSMDGGKS
jgi:hypothetical protein